MMAIVGEGAAAQLIETNDLCSLKATPQVNISLDNVIYFNEDVKLGQTMPVSLEVENIGGVPVNGIVVKVNGTTVSTVPISGGLLTGNTSTVEFGLNIPAGMPEQTDFVISVEPSGQTDADMSDNSQTITLGHSNIRLFVDKRYNEDYTVSVLANVENESDFATNAKLLVYRGELGGEAIDFVDLGNVSGRQNVAEEFAFDPDALLTGGDDFEVIYFELVSDSVGRFSFNKTDFTVIFANKKHSIGITLDPDTDKVFSEAAVGYGAQTPHNVTVSNTGEEPTGPLTIALSGADSASFALNKDSINNIESGESESFTVTPITGLAEGSYNATVTVSGDNGIWASFNVSFAVTDSGGSSNITHTISVGNRPGGRISPSGNVSVNNGASQTFTITADNGYHIGYVEVDGVNVGAVSTYRFENVTRNHTINAIFRRNTRNDTSGSSGTGATLGGSNAPTQPSTQPSNRFEGGSNSYQKGSGRDIVHITQKDFSLFSDVRVNGNTLVQNTHYRAESGSTRVTLLSGYLETLPAGQHTLTVHFTDNEIATASFTVNEVATPMPITSQIPANPFVDVNAGNWFIDDVIYVYSNGLMSGTSTNPMMFSPNVPLTRSMIVAILYRHAGSPNVSALANPFGDVPAGTWYTDAVKWAADNGIVSGIGNGRFGPDNNITRQDLTVILARYADFANINLTPMRDYTGFNDEANISAYAKNAVERFFRAGFISGKPNNMFDPRGNATRAEVAAMLHRFLGQ
jgi:hypothetical protein